MQNIWKTILRTYHLADAVQWLLNLHLVLFVLIGVFPHAFKYVFLVVAGVLLVQIGTSLFRRKYISAFLEIVALMLGYAILHFPYELQLPLLVILEIVLISDFRNFRHPHAPFNNKK